MFFRLFSACFLLAMNSLFADSIIWTTDYQNALSKAQKENKPLILFFSGSDWSGWSMKMKKEILDAPEFAEKIGSEFLCVQIDFPKHHSLTKVEKDQNSFLKDHFEIGEYPRLILLDPSEREIARIGYCSESAEKCAEDLIHIIQRDTSLTKVMQNLPKNTFNSSELKTFYLEARELHRSEDSLVLLDVGLKSNDPHFFLLEKYRLLVEEGKGQNEEAIGLYDQLIRLYPNNARGTQFSLALIHFQELATKERVNLNPKEVIKPLEEYLALYGKTDPENVWRVEMMIAQFYLDTDECKTALKHAETAYQAAPNHKKQEIEQSLDYIRKQTECIVEAGL